MEKNIVLIGMMGVGKTALGRQLAEEMGYEFVDLDARLEEACSLKLHEIYRKYGAIRYYAEETLLLKKQLGTSRRVIAAGGAVLPNDEQAALIAALGVAVWLKADPEAMLRRIKRKHNQLFLGKSGDLVQEIERRGTIYGAMADLTVNLDGKSIESAVDRICEFMREQA